MKQVWLTLDGNGLVKQIWHSSPPRTSIASGLQVVKMSIPEGQVPFLIGRTYVEGRLVK